MKRSIFLLTVLAAACDAPQPVETNLAAASFPAEQAGNGQPEQGAGPANTKAGIDKPDEPGNSTQESTTDGPGTPSTPPDGEPVVQSAASNGSDRAPPPRPAPPEFFYTFRLNAESSRATHESHVSACRASVGHCRVLASNIRVIDDNDVQGEMILGIDRDSAQRFVDWALGSLRRDHQGDIVQGEINDSLPAPADAAPRTSNPQARIVFRYLDPRSGWERGWDRIDRNFDALLVVLLVIFVTIGPWLLLGWLLWMLYPRGRNAWRKMSRWRKADATPADDSSSPTPPAPASKG